jgi:hypothetical protein
VLAPEVIPNSIVRNFHQESCCTFLPIPKGSRELSIKV